MHRKKCTVKEGKQLMPQVLQKVHLGNRQYGKPDSAAQHCCRDAPLGLQPAHLGKAVQDVGG